MNKLTLLLPIFALAACGQEPAPEPVPTTTPEPVKTLPAPNQASFSALLGEACPSAEKVNTAVCKRAGMGSKDVVCEFGLGEDTYLRHKATLTAGEDAWTLADADAVCAEHGTHHK
ncbi:hypothetical protein [Qipengyuania marisflavi]|uniref:hypothetical protein n=1 Tax=Qipengyuania marisflavi TaxID=2486356 RepID=UPI001FE4C909|nr:hypothetical protein [Qipengyuania marisflavi]